MLQRALVIAVVLENMYIVLVRTAGWVKHGMHDENGIEI